jgi:hypothetical protein
MSRTQLKLLIVVSVLINLVLGAWVGLWLYRQPEPEVAQGAPEEPVEVPEGVAPEDEGRPVWMTRVGPTDKGGEKGPTLRAPDQPGWTTRVGPTHYELTLGELVVLARTTVRLGEVVGEGDVRRVEPFVLAALALEEDGEDDMVLLEQVVRALREQKIVTFAKPVGLSFPENPALPGTWEDDRKAWIGVPVPLGTTLTEPLKEVPFQGADVVAADPYAPPPGTAEDWASLVTAAGDAGREAAFPLLYRFSGWIPALPDVHVQLVLPLEDQPAPSP